MTRILAAHYRRAALVFAAMVLALVATTAFAQPFPPRPDGPVYDGADMIDAGTEAALEIKLREYNARTGRAIIIATVPDIGGQNIEPYATALFAEWGIGGAERDQGLLLLIAKQERKMRIEIGYGLHPYFGGIMAGRVINDTITPAFKAGDFSGGIASGVDEIIAHLDRSPEDARAIEEAAAAAAAKRSKEGGFPVGALIWLAFIFFFFVLPMLKGGRRRRYRSGLGGTVGDIILWEAGKAVARGMSDSGGHSSGGFGGFSGGGGGGFGGFGGGMSGGGGASGGW